MLDLGTLGGDASTAFALSNDGHVVGGADLKPGQFHAFRWSREGGMRDLGTLGGPNSTARALNDSGDVVGDAEVTPGVTHAFLWHDGKMRDLGDPNG